MTTPMTITNTQQIIIDTNALLALAEYNIDISSELDHICDTPYKVHVLQATLDELEEIKHHSLKLKRRILLIHRLLKHLNITILPDEGYADDILLDYSYKHYLILTQDKALKQRLQKPYLTIRQKRKILIVR